MPPPVTPPLEAVTAEVFAEETAEVEAAGGGKSGRLRRSIPLLAAVSTLNGRQVLRGAKCACHATGGSFWKNQACWDMISSTTYKNTKINSLRDNEKMPK